MRSLHRPRSRYASERAVIIKNKIKKILYKLKYCISLYPIFI